MDPAAALAAFQQMQQQITTLQQQLAHQPPGGAAPAQRVERPRLPPPSQYDGRSAAALDGSSFSSSSIGTASQTMRDASALPRRC